MIANCISDSLTPGFGTVANLRAPMSARRGRSGEAGLPASARVVADDVRRLQMGGDQDAAARLVEHLYPLVAKILQRRLPSQVALEDVAQQVFLKVFAKLDQFRGEVPLEHWVSQVAIKTCLNAMRGKRLRLEVRRGDLSESEDAVLDQVAAVDSDPDVGDAVAARELVDKLLECLSPKERLAVELIELEGHTSQEAADLLGSSAIALRVRVTRARAKMRKHLDILQSSNSKP